MIGSFFFFTYVPVINMSDLFRLAGVSKRDYILSDSFFEYRMPIVYFIMKLLSSFTLYLLPLIHCLPQFPDSLQITETPCPDLAPTSQLSDGDLYTDRIDDYYEAKLKPRDAACRVDRNSAPVPLHHAAPKKETFPATSPGSFQHCQPAFPVLSCCMSLISSKGSRFLFKACFNRKYSFEFFIFQRKFCTRRSWISFESLSYIPRC